MEKFPNFENTPENPNRLADIVDAQGEELDALMEKKGYGLFEKLKGKLNTLILCGSLSLVVVGCDSKKSEQTGTNEGASRFPRTEEVNINKRTLERRKIGNEIRLREENEYAVTKKRALEIAAKHGVDINKAMGGKKSNLKILDLRGVPIRIELNGQKIEVTREDLTEKELDTLKNKARDFSEQWDQKPDNDAPPEMQAMDREINQNRREVRAVLERLEVNETVGSKPNQVRTSPDFESQPKIKGSKEVPIDDF